MNEFLNLHPRSWKHESLYGDPSRAVARRRRGAVDRINTLNGAYASHEEHSKGSIAAGKLADYVVLAEDPHSVAVDKIKDIKIVRTVTGGNTVYEA